MHADNAQGTFARREQKYLFGSQSYRELMAAIGSRLEDDPFGHAVVSSLYYDTPSFDLICRSLEKPVYKEKLRLRSYANYRADGLPVFDRNAPVYAELKKKFDGIVYKRRVPMSMRDAYDFMDGAPFRQALETPNTPHLHAAVVAQIAAELKATIGRYPGLAPAMMVVVDRRAFHAIEDAQLRITFDVNPRYRTAALDFACGFDGLPILADGQVIMEVKCASAYPRWLIDALNGISAFPQACSKYGRAYQAALRGRTYPLSAVAQNNTAA